MYVTENLEKLNVIRTILSLALDAETFRFFACFEFVNSNIFKSNYGLFWPKIVLVRP